MDFLLKRIVKIQDLYFLKTSRENTETNNGNQGFFLKKVDVVIIIIIIFFFF